MLTKRRDQAVLIVDPQRLRQAGLVRLLETWAESSGLEVVGISQPEELLIHANCVMVLLSVGGVSVQARTPRLWIKSIRTVLENAPLVILSDRDDGDEIRAAFREGAIGFILTSLDPCLAMDALTLVHHGGTFFPPSILLEEDASPSNGSSIPDRQGQPTPLLEPPAAEIKRSVRIVSTRVSTISPGTQAEEPKDLSSPPLTPRQSEVLERLGEGKPNKVIARDLNMTEATVKVHVRQIMRKFGVTNRTQAALFASRFDSAFQE